MGSASRIVGQGGLLRTLRALIAKVDKFSAHRARTREEVRWANCLADALERALNAAMTPAARASLEAVDRRRALSQKHRQKALSRTLRTSDAVEVRTSHGV
jgi:hypothetical protein